MTAPFPPPPLLFCRGCRVAAAFFLLSLACLVAPSSSDGATPILPSYLYGTFNSTRSVFRASDNPPQFANQFEDCILTRPGAGPTEFKRVTLSPEGVFLAGHDCPLTLTATPKTAAEANYMTQSRGLLSSTVYSDLDNVTNSAEGCYCSYTIKTSSEQLNGYLKMGELLYGPNPLRFCTRWKLTGDVLVFKSDVGQVFRSIPPRCPQSADLANPAGDDTNRLMYHERMVRAPVDRPAAGKHSDLDGVGADIAALPAFAVGMAVVFVSYALILAGALVRWPCCPAATRSSGVGTAPEAASGGAGGSGAAAAAQRQAWTRTALIFSVQFFAFGISLPTISPLIAQSKCAVEGNGCNIFESDFADAASFVAIISTISRALRFLVLPM